MPKRLALCLDGTWHTREDRTNPYRMSLLIARDAPDRWRQVVYYDEGVGTRWHDWLSGGAIGWGLSENIRDAYAWLARRYEDGDEIFLFGFSRGAYTARSLVGLIRKCGLLRVEPRTGPPALAASVREAYELYRKRHRSPDVEEARRFRSQYSREIPVRFIGVWDTVGRLGIPFPRIPFGSDDYRFHDTRLSRIVQDAYQALAIDEQRADFAPTLWTEKPEETRMEQRWFVGTHANVGGGHPRDPLPALALHWIQRKAAECGLAMAREVPVKADAYLAPVRDSFAEFLSGAYRLAHLGRRYHRPIGGTVNETLDESVLRRRAEETAYRPPELEKYLRRRG
jgi:uncharacterized protein (DUF2235 family)